MSLQANTSRKDSAVVEEDMAEVVVEEDMAEVEDLMEVAEGEEVTEVVHHLMDQEDLARMEGLRDHHMAEAVEEEEVHMVLHMEEVAEGLLMVAAQMVGSLLLLERNKESPSIQCLFSRKKQNIFVVSNKLI
jgi:hypothetical protein